MRVAIVWSGDEELLYQTMEKLITDSQCFLFTVVCGCRESAGFRYAQRVGAPTAFISVDDIIKEAEYLVAYNDGSPQLRNLIMRFKMAGKHGTVVN